MEYNYFTNNFYRDSYQKKFIQLSLNGYQLWHLTITWREYKRERLSPKILNMRLKNWWIKNFIPHIYQRTNFNTKTRLEQPHCVGFVEFGEDTDIIHVKSLYNPVTNEYMPSKIFNNLHHHIIIATRDEATKKLFSLKGKNTLKDKIESDNKYGNRIKKDPITNQIVNIHNMTQHIKESHLIPITNFEEQLRYPSKQLWFMGVNSVFEFTPTPKPPKRKLMIRPNSQSNEVVVAPYKVYVSCQKQSSDIKRINRRMAPSEQELTSPQAS